VKKWRVCFLENEWRCLVVGGEIKVKELTPELLFVQLETYLAREQIDILKNAYDIAVSAHKGQKRASGEDYIVHPLGVAYILAMLQLDADSIAAALLHDVAEDTNATIEDIKECFGAEVALLVDGLTKLGRIEYLSKEDQQAENYRKMFLAMAKDIRVVLIKLADRLHNMRTLGYMPPDKQKAIARETLELFAPLAHRLGIYTIKWELEDLSFRYLEPATYDGLVDEVKAQRRERESIIDQAMATLKNELDKVNIECRIHGRAKNIYSIYRKMQRDHKELGEIYDILAIRVLVGSVKDCYGVLGIAHTIWKPMPGRFKDYIAMPKSNMYQSLHTTVMSNQGQPLEIQIRTFEMHRISEYGIAAHWRYKEGGKSAGKSFEQKLSWLRQMLEWHKDMRDTREFVDTVKTDVFTEEEVFVFTPRGDVIDLPAGAVPVDFAYRIHTDVGNRCIGAKINGRIMPLEHKLSNGDIVEIITSKQANGPSRDWLNIVASSDSKSKIRSWFKKARREENIAKGRELLERESKRLGYDIKTFLKSERLKNIAVKMNLVSEDNLLASLGYGGLTVPGVITKLVEMHKAELKIDMPQEISQMLSELKPKGGKSKASQGILVKGETGLMIRLARCCSPVPGDRIIGYITRGRGVSVHRSDCLNILNSNDEFARMIDVSWDADPNSLYRVSIEAMTTDRPGVLAEIVSVPSDIKVNVSALKVKTNHRNKTANLSMELEINDLSQLEHILSKMRRFKDVISVERHSAKGD
jgi:GTP pyrophosphokinase